MREAYIGDTLKQNSQISIFTFSLKDLIKFE